MSRTQLRRELEADVFRPDLEALPCLCGTPPDDDRVLAARDEVSGEVFVYRRCGACGLERLSPRPTRERIGRFYPDSYAAWSRATTILDRVKRLNHRVFYAPLGKTGGVAAPARWLLRTVLYPLRKRGVLAFRPPAVRRVFEFGAATGQDLLAFKAVGWEVAGCEPSARACEAAAARGIALQQCGAEEAEMPADGVSCILMNNVFEHLHDPVRVLAKCRAALTEDGVLVLIVPNHASWSARLFGGAWPGYDAPRHLWGYAPASLARLMDRAGFRIERIDHETPGRWCFAGCLGGARLAAGAPRWRSRVAPWIAPALLPFGLLAATCGAGDFMKIVARRA